MPYSNARQELINGLKRDLYSFWFEEVMQQDHPSMYRQIFDSTAMQGSAEVKNSALLNVHFKKTTDGESVSYTDPTSGRKHVMKLERYTAALPVARDLVEKDAQKDALRNMLREWQGAARRQFELEKEAYFADVAFNKAGFTAGDAIYNQTSALFDDPSGALAYDSKPLLNLTGNARTKLVAPRDGTSNSFYNSIGATASNLTSDNFDTCYELISYNNAFSEAGNRIIQRPTHLIVPPTLRTEAYQILETQSGIPGEVNNGANQNQGIVQVVLNPFITNSDAWYLYSKTGKFLAYDREEPIFDIWFCQETKQWKVSIDVRYGHGILDFSCIAGGNVPTS